MRAPSLQGCIHGVSRNGLADNRHSPVIDNG
jgi:hypothetical protein